jgi:hypothetical protein
MRLGGFRDFLENSTPPVNIQQGVRERMLGVMDEHRLRGSVRRVAGAELTPELEVLVHGPRKG